MSVVIANGRNQSSFSVKECLQGYTNDTLGIVCEKWQLAASNKPSRIRAIERILTDPLHIDSALQALNPPAVRLLHLLCAHPGCLVSDVLSVPALLGPDGRVLATLQDLVSRGLALIMPLDRSGAFSLSQIGRDYHGNGIDLSLHVPELVRTKLPPSLPLGYKLPVADPPGETNGKTGSDSAVGAFLETLRVVEILGPRITATGELHKSDSIRARELAQEAGVSTEALTLALMMGLQLGCIESREGRLAVTPTASKWAESPEAQRVKDLFHSFTHSEELPDLKLFFPQIFPAMQEHLPAGSLRRTYHKTLVAAILREQPADAWHTTDGFVDTLRRADSNLLFLEERWRAIASNTSDPTPSWRERMWQTHERRLFIWLIQSLFARLGLVQLANEGQLFRITGLGRFALGVGEAPAESAESAPDALVIQPDFEVIAYLDRCSADLRRKLDAFCERVRVGQVGTYKLTQDSLYRGLRSGVAGETFIRILEAHTQRGIPNNVRKQIETWVQKAENIVIRTNCQILECSDPAVLAEWLRKYPHAQMIGERFLLLPSGATLPNKPPVKGLVRIDYTKPIAPCLFQEPGLRLRAPWSRTSLLLKNRLVELGTVNESDSGDLVLELARTALKKGVDWGLFAAQLEALVEGALAARYRTALRAWCGEAEPLTTHTATLLRFDDADACEAVLDMTDSMKIIEGRIGLRTLVVAKGALPALKRELQTLGLRIGKDGAVLDDGPPEEWAAQWVETHKSETEQDTQESASSEDAGDDIDDTPLPSYSPRIVGEIIEDAIRRRRPVLIRYQSAYSKNPTVRRVNPVAVDVLAATPTVSGYCHRLGAAREFKLSRILGIRLLEDETF
ncbi:MAG: helicase C-terminal domain-containing protein [Candidatus Hydrogenedentes bacterium]|nr:helicase C-terminal domain-containing protein [Candidatus Hydrogenedentota bacterium]